MQRLGRDLGDYAGLALVVLAIIAAIVTTAWTLRVLTAPLRHAGPPVDLGPYGLPGVMVRIVYPNRLDTSHVGADAAVITVTARAASSEVAQPFELLLPLPDEALAYLNSEGEHVAGRLRIVPGYPEAAPVDLRVAHGRTQYRAYPLFPYRVTIVPVVQGDGVMATIPELAFTIRLVSRWEQGLRRFAEILAVVMTPLLVAATIVMGVGWSWRRAARRQEAARVKRLAVLYQRLREHVKLERWADARDLLEQIRATDAHYRDIDHLDTVISAAETADWRREQLYNLGARAYRERNWPDAVHALQPIEAEAPYYREVRFLLRTACLYADLQSRDRSLRLRSAQDLGQVADLLDMTPLLHALGDRSDDVADAAETSFRHIGLDAFDVLLAGLIYGSPAAADDPEGLRHVRERSYRLIEQMGQNAREPLLGALRSSDPQITAAAASLLIKLGARQDVADALLWVAAPHREGLLNALLTEGTAATVPLVQTLLKAPPGHEQFLINALIRLKSRQNIERHLTEVMRSTTDKDKAAILRRILDTPADQQDVSDDEALTGRASVPARAVSHGELEPAEKAAGEPAHDTESQRQGIWPLRLLDKRRS